MSAYSGVKSAVALMIQYEHTKRTLALAFDFNQRPDLLSSYIRENKQLPACVFGGNFVLVKVFSNARRHKNACIKVHLSA